MKHLLRERQQQSLSLFQRCKQALGYVFQNQPSAENFELDDFVSGLSPETLMKLRRVQGGLSDSWASAAPVPFKGSSVWANAKKQVVAISLPKMRTPLRQLLLGETSDDVRGLDDIFPERITGFFMDEKSSKKSVDSAKAKKRLFEPPTQPEVPRFDETLRRQIRWPQLKPMARPEAAQLAETHTSVNTTAAVKATMPTSLLALLGQKLSEALTKPDSNIHSVPAMRVELKPVMQERPQPISELISEVPKKPIMTVAPVIQIEPPTLPTLLGTETIEALVQSIPQVISEMTLSEEPQPIPDMVMSVSPSRPERLQELVVERPQERSIIKPVTRANPEQYVERDLSSVDFMVRNNQILSSSISFLVDRYFQQSALEEEVSL